MKKITTLITIHSEYEIITIGGEWVGGSGVHVGSTIVYVYV